MKSLNLDHIKQRIGHQPSRHEHEFQEVCSLLEPIYGKLVWTLPYQPGVTEWKIREAHRIAVQRGITRYAYLKGIIKKLP